MSLSVRVIDGVHGRPAAGITARMERAAEPRGWDEQCRCRTGDAGEIDAWPQASLHAGLYRLEFDTDAYFATLGVTPCYKQVVLEFRLPDTGYPQTIHLLISPSSHVTYWQR